MNTSNLNVKLFQTWNTVWSYQLFTCSYLSKIYQITYFNLFKNIFGKHNPFAIFLLLPLRMIFSCRIEEEESTSKSKNDKLEKISLEKVSALHFWKDQPLYHYFYPFSKFIEFPPSGKVKKIYFPSP